MQVFAGVENGQLKLEPAREPITVHHLLTHTGGLVYDFTAQPAELAALYDESLRSVTLAEQVARLADLPLMFQPGANWWYSFSTDVLGHLVEVVADMSLRDFFRARILGPLGLVDTDFCVPAEQYERLTTLYRHEADGSQTLVDAPPDTGLADPTLNIAGGTGLVSTADDYLRFTLMLRGGGALDGVRLLSRKTVEYMTMNHLPPALVPIHFPEGPRRGMGFGLGFGVVLDPAVNRVLRSVGEYHWGGAASTRFWIDPAEDLICVMMTQLLSAVDPIPADLTSAVNQALVD
jgi:CubicO group peptidase (beta-lactamase class C family)